MMKNSGFTRSSGPSRVHIVVCPNHLDIICGRSKAAAAHPGNKRFRVIAAKYFHPYYIATTKKAKVEVKHAAMKAILSSNCTRFLKKDPIFEKYYVASQRTAGDKILNFFKAEAAHRHTSRPDNNRLHQQSYRRFASIEQVQALYRSLSDDTVENAYGGPAPTGEGTGIMNATQSNNVALPFLRNFHLKEDMTHSIAAIPQPFPTQDFEQHASDNFLSSLAAHPSQSKGLVLLSTQQENGDHNFGMLEGALMAPKKMEEPGELDTSSILPPSASAFQHLPFTTDNSVSALAPVSDGCKIANQQLLVDTWRNGTIGESHGSHPLCDSNDHQPLLQEETHLVTTPLERMCYDLGLFVLCPEQNQLTTEISIVSIQPTTQA